MNKCEPCSRRIFQILIYRFLPSNYSQAVLRLQALLPHESLWQLSRWGCLWDPFLPRFVSKAQAFKEIISRILEGEEREHATEEKLQEKFQVTLEEAKIWGLQNLVGPTAFDLAVPGLVARPQKGTAVLPTLSKDFLFPKHGRTAGPKGIRPM